MKSIQKYVRHVGRLPEIFTGARTFDPFLPVTLDYLDAKRLAFPSDTGLPNGLKVRLTEREDVKILWHIFVRRCYEVSGAESVILDLGANVGFFALYAATNAPRARVVSVEPVPSTFQRLSRHLESNNLAGRVSAMNGAVGAHAGRRFVALENVPAGQRRLLVDGKENARPGVEVSCYTLESILDQYDLRSVDLAKVDIEGSEFEVLLATPAAMLRRISRMEIEIHNNVTAQGHTSDELIAHLQTAGLMLASIETDALGFSQARFVRQN